MFYLNDESKWETKILMKDSSTKWMRITEDMTDIILLQLNIKDLRERHSIPLWLFGDYFS